MTSHARNLSRREALRLITVAGVGAAAAVAGGCTPLRVGLKLYPAEFKYDDDLVDRVLASFVRTVVMDERTPDTELTRQFHDTTFALEPHRGFLAADLCERAGRLTGQRLFYLLDSADRTRVIADGLAAGGVSTRLYNGAIHLTQVAYYAGIYDDEKGCPAIGFDGRFQPGAVRTSYAEPGRFRSAESTANGNPV